MKEIKTSLSEEQKKIFTDFKEYVEEKGKIYNEIQKGMRIAGRIIKDEESEKEYKNLENALNGFANITSALDNMFFNFEINENDMLAVKYNDFKSTNDIKLAIIVSLMNNMVKISYGRGIVEQYTYKLSDLNGFSSKMNYYITELIRIILVL